MAKFVRFEDDADVEWLKAMMQRAIDKMKKNTSLLSEENAVIVPRILDALLSAVDLDMAAAIGVPAEIIKEEEIKVKEAKAAKKATRARKKTSTKTHLPNLCKEHPTYGAMRVTNRDCKGCWDAYKEFHPLEYEKAYRDFKRRQKKKNASA